MKKSYRFLVTALFLGSLLLGACSGALPQDLGSPQSPAGSSQSTEAVFTGTVESYSGTFWLISGQQVDVDASTVIDPNIQVGDLVKVEASVSSDGKVVALKIESSVPDDVSANDNSANSNAANSNDNVNMNDNTNSSDDNSNSANDNANVNDNTNSAPSGTSQETFGVVEAISADSITIDGITYGIANFTEFKDIIAAGDQVKIHLIVNDDGSLTILEIEKSTGTSIGDDNSNTNDSSWNSNDDKSSNFNSNDDDHNNNSNSNSNDDDDHDDDNSNNSNDD